jgi:hypothetical protein
MTLSKLGGNLLGCLSDDLQAAHEGTAKRLVRPERLRGELLTMCDEVVGLGRMCRRYSRGAKDIRGFG